MAEYITFQPSDYYNTTLYTGNGTAIGSGGNAITGVGFQADVTWMKQRNGTNNHNLQNSAVGATKYLNPDRNIAQVTNTESLTTWGADGFTLGNLADVNGSGNTFVSWNWKMGTTTGIDTTGSTITPTSYSFNATARQSVVAYTGNGTSGAKVAHGLGVAPQYISIHRLDDISAWDVFHHKQHNTDPEDYYLDWSTSTQSTSNTTRFGGSPDAVNFTIGDSGYVNASGGTFIAYCWAGKSGYSKFGFYDGNGNADGPFIYTGFRPAYILFKQRNVARDWVILDDKRVGYNPVINQLQINSTGAETTDNSPVDFLNNGFKINTTKTWYNDSAAYVYAAFAEFPIVSSTDVPGVAR